MEVLSKDPQVNENSIKEQTSAYSPVNEQTFF